MSNIKSKCFGDETYWKGLFLKKVGGCATFFALRVNIASWTCLDRPGLEHIFHWKFHSIILSTSSQSCLAVAFGQFTILNKEVPFVCKNVWVWLKMFS